MYKAILVVHIAAGFVSLSAGIVAAVSKSLDLAHRVHVRSGQLFFRGMVTIFVTAVVMALVRPNGFLLMIAIFSFYMALTGWRLAKNRKGTPAAFDWTVALAMFVTGVIMIGYGIVTLNNGSSFGITTLVFGTIGVVFACADAARLRAGGVTGKARIAGHQTAMMGATIATMTAFVVTNFSMNPAFVLWIAPTVLFTPVVIWWNAKLLGGSIVKLEPA